MLVTKAHQIAVAVAFVLLTAWLLIGGWQSSQPVHPSIQYRGTAAEHRGSDRQPIEERKKTDEAIARYTWWLMMFTGILAFATIGLGVATVGLYLAGEKQITVARDTADAAKSGNELTREIFIAEQWPWLLWDLPNLVTITRTNNQLHIRLEGTIKNIGKTPALNLIYFGKLYLPGPQEAGVNQGTAFYSEHLSGALAQGFSVAY
jgi:hypothetical protein